MKIRRPWPVCAALAVAALARTMHGEPPSTVDVERAMALAVAHHPIADEDVSAIRATAARVEVERAKYWPDLEVFAQLARSTSSTVGGALFTVPNLPAISGAQRRVFDLGNFGSSGGATASWDALGPRRWDASIDQAKAEVRAARASASARELDLAYGAADRVIVAVARDEAVKAARAGVDRARVFVTIVKAAVDQNLRPGADL